jgi:hypothetical protein
VKLGLQIPDFTQPGGPPTLGADLAGVARAADDTGFGIVAVMDHLFQIPDIGPPERDMLEAYTTRAAPAVRGRDARLRHDREDGLLPFDLSNGLNALVDQLGPLAEAGLQTVIGFVSDLWSGKAVETMARDVIPQVASL